MSYFSPFRLFPFVDFSKENSESIPFSKLKRKLLAEFELNDDQSIVIGGEFIGKSEVLNLLESLKNEELFQDHLEIAKDKELLLFLEGDSYEYLFEETNYTKIIPSLVSVEFVEEYDRVISKAYQQGDEGRLIQMLTFPVQDVVTSSNSPYEGIFRKLKNEVTYLDELINKTGK